MKCSQKTCEEPASYTYVHPGQAARSYACTDHVLLAKRIADIAGYTLGDLRVCTMEELCRGNAEPLDADELARRVP